MGLTEFLQKWYMKTYQKIQENMLIIKNEYIFSVSVHPFLIKLVPLCLRGVRTHDLLLSLQETNNADL